MKNFGFYIKVNRKKSLKDLKAVKNETPNKSTFQTKTFIPKNVYFTEEKNNKIETKHFFGPIDREIKDCKTNKNNDKYIKETNTTPMNKKYKKKIIHIDNTNKNNKTKNRMQFQQNNYLNKSDKSIKKFKNYFSPKNINIHNSNNSQILNIKGRTDLRTPKNNLINKEHNSSIKISKEKFKKSLYSNIKNLKLFKDNRLINKNANNIIPALKYSKTIINNRINNSQSNKKKKYLKKPKNISKEIEKDKQMINIYKTKLVTIFVKLIEDFYKKQKRRIFSYFIYKLKDGLYFFEVNKFKMNNKINNNIYKNKIYDYNSKPKNQFIIGNNFTKYLFPNKDFQSMTMYHLRFNKNDEYNNEKIYIPKNKRYEENTQINEKYFDNNRSNPKYNIFNNMNIKKNPQKILDEQDIYKNQNINTQINNYYNTKNTNFYFNKINSFNSLIIEKQRPRHYFPKHNKKQTSPDIKINVSLNKKTININSNTPKSIENNFFHNKSKTLIYKKIFSKENKKKSDDDNIESLVNKTEKIFHNTNNNDYNILAKNKDFLINNYMTISNNTKDNNNIVDISNEFNNYCLEDIDKPMNIIYSKNEFEEGDNIEGEDIININSIKRSDGGLFLNFNYYNYNSKRKGKEFMYENRMKNKLLITKTNSIFILNDKERISNQNNINFNIIRKIENIINNRIYKYKSDFLNEIKKIKFKQFIRAILQSQNIAILKKYFYLMKRNIKLDKGIISDSSNDNAKENLDNKNDVKTKYGKKLKLFRTNLLKFFFSKK